MDSIHHRITTGAAEAVQMSHEGQGGPQKKWLWDIGAHLHCPILAVLDGTRTDAPNMEPPSGASSLETENKNTRGVNDLQASVPIRRCPAGTGQPLLAASSGMGGD